MTSSIPACLLTLCVLLAACTDSTSDEAPTPVDGAPVVDAGTAARTSAERGYADARAAIAAGEPRIRFFGMPDFSTGDMDPRTGVPYDGQGCEITDEASAHTAAFNAEIRRAVVAGELEGRHLRHKATTRDAVAALFAEDEGREIAPGSGPVPAPGGRFSVEVAPDPETDEPYLWVRDARTKARRQLTWFDGERARILFAADGETLFLCDEENEILQTHDLPTALFMQGWEGPAEDFGEEPESDDE